MLDRTFCKPAGFLFKQIIPSGKPFILLCCLPGSLPACQEHFSRRFGSSRSVQAAAGTPSSSSCRGLLFPPGSRQPMHLLATQILLRERRVLYKRQDCWGPSFHKIPARVKRSPLASLELAKCHAEQATSSRLGRAKLPRGWAEAVCWPAEPLAASAAHIPVGLVCQSATLPTATSNQSSHYSPSGRRFLLQLPLQLEI